MTKIGIPTGMLLSTLTAIGCSANVSEIENLSVVQSELTTTTKYFVSQPNPDAVKQIALSSRRTILRTRCGCHYWLPRRRRCGSRAERPATFSAPLRKRWIAPRWRTRSRAGCLQHPLPRLRAVFRRRRHRYSGLQGMDRRLCARLGKGRAVVILEPDSLGIIPYNTTIYGASEWCRPTVTAERR